MKTFFITNIINGSTLFCFFRPALFTCQGEVKCMFKEMEWSLIYQDSVEKHGRQDHTILDPRLDQPCFERWWKKKAISKSGWLSHCVKGSNYILNLKSKTLGNFRLVTKSTAEIISLFTSSQQWSSHWTFFLQILSSMMSFSAMP